MPYKVKGKCVYKKDTGKKVGCTKGSVKKYLAALHMHADESKEHNEELLETLEEIIEEELQKPLPRVLIPGSYRSKPEYLDSDYHDFLASQPPPQRPSTDSVIQALFKKLKNIYTLRFEEQKKNKLQKIIQEAFTDLNLDI